MPPNNERRGHFRIKHFQSWHLISALNAGAARAYYMTACFATQLSGSGCQMTSQLSIALIRKQHRSLMCLAYFFDMLSMGVCTTRYWQTPGRLVQDLNVCNVRLVAFFSLFRGSIIKPFVHFVTIQISLGHLRLSCEWLRAWRKKVFLPMTWFPSHLCV